MRGVVVLLLALGCGVDNSRRDPREALAPLYQYTRDLATWERRAADVRQGIRDGTGLNTLPPRTPLNADSHSRRDRGGYTVENVVFQSLPGVYVTGNLYRPVGSGPFPLLLQIHGHFHPDDFSARTDPNVQAASGQLARMGAIVFVPDLVGYGEFTQLLRIPIAVIERTQGHCSR